MSYQPVWDGRSGYGGKKNRHILRKVIGALLLLAVLAFAAIQGQIQRGARGKISGQPQVMVILGCQVKPDGPSILLRDRLDTALTYLEDHPDLKIVVTGGKGDDEHQSEAQCMYDYLTAHGVDGEKIYLEDRSRNTWQNFQYSRNVMETAGLDITEGTLVVSSGFHLTRAEMLAGRAGFTEISTLPAPVSHKPSAVQMFFREPLALVKSFVFDR